MSVPDITFHDVLSKADVSAIEQWLAQYSPPGGVGHLDYFRNLVTDGDATHYICARQQGQVVGFLSWKQYPDPTVMKILLCAVKPDLRLNGLGRCLVNMAFTRLTDEGCHAVHLACDPPESEAFWRRVGLVAFPPEHSASDRTGILFGGRLPLRLYKIIAPSLVPSPPKNANDVVDLWPAVPGDTAASGEPRWRWSLPAAEDLKNDSPCIVVPCDLFWRLRVTCGATGAVLFDDSAFCTDSIDTSWSDFLVLAPNATIIIDEVRRREERLSRRFSRTRSVPPS
jgi:N-acetylglutamate synthase-like GNAT family acetyltransferase